MRLPYPEARKRIDFAHACRANAAALKSRSTWKPGARAVWRWMRAASTTTSKQISWRYSNRHFRRNSAVDLRPISAAQGNRVVHQPALHAAEDQGAGGMSRQQQLLYLGGKVRRQFHGRFRRMQTQRRKHHHRRRGTPRRADGHQRSQFAAGERTSARNQLRSEENGFRILHPVEKKQQSFRRPLTTARMAISRQIW